MKYYQEFLDEEKTQPFHNVVMARIDNDHIYTSIGMTEDKSHCGKTFVNDKFLAKYCKRVSAKLARELHPELFVYLVRNGLLKR